MRSQWTQVKDYLYNAFDELSSSYFILSFIPQALKVVQEDPNRVEMFLDLLNEASLRSPQITGTHLNDIVKLLPFVSGEVEEKLFETIVYSLIADDSCIEDCLPLLERTHGSRISIQLLAIMEKRASNTPLSAACVNYCFNNEFSEETELLIKLINAGNLVPSLKEFPEPSNDYTQLRLAVALSRVLDSKTKKKLESSMIKPMMKAAKKDPLFSQTKTVLDY